MKISILQKYNNLYNPIAEITTPNKIDYAEKHDYDFIDDKSVMNTENEKWYWMNTRAMINVLESDVDCDWFYYCDVDSLIMNKKIKLDSFLKDTDGRNFVGGIWVKKHPFGLYLNKTNGEVVKKKGIGMLYMLATGHLFIRNCKESLDQLKKIYKDKRFTDNMIKAVGADELVYGFHYMNDVDFRKSVKQLSLDKFFSFPKENNIFKRHKDILTDINDYKKKEFILHAPAPNLDDSDADIVKYKKEILESYLEKK